MSIVILALLWLLRVYLYVMFARVIISFVQVLAPQWRVPTGVRALFEIVYTLTDPPIRLVGRFVKPVDLGGVRLDLAFTVVLIALIVVQRLLEVWLRLIAV